MANGLAKNGRKVATTVPEISQVLLNKRGVAELIRTSTRTVEHHMKRGMPHIKLTPRCTRFIPADVMAWLKTRQVN